jgi:AraC-like DNA-binding protein
VSEPLPHRDLAAHVHRLTVLDATPDEPLHRALPNGCVSVIFKRYRSGATRLYVSGPLTGPLLVPLSGLAEAVFVQFRPGAAHAFVGRPMAALRDRRVPLGAMWGEAARDLHRRLRRSSAPSDDLQRSLAARCGAADRRVGECVRAIAETGGSITMASLSARVGTSPRALVRAFERSVGVAPKVLARIVRFQSVVARLPDAARHWAFAAVEHGYSDQQHLIRDFRRFAGLPPDRFVQDA